MHTLNNYQLIGLVLISICVTLVAVGTYVVIAREIHQIRTRRKYTVRRREGRFLHKI